MADLYGTAPSSFTGVAPESEEMSMSTFLDQFLRHNSSSSSKTKYVHFHNSLQHPQPPEATCADGGFFSVESRLGFGRSANRSESERCVRDGNSGTAVESSNGVNFSDPRGYFTADVKESTENTFSSAGVVGSDTKGRRVSFENYHGELSCDSEKGAEGSEVPANSVPPRSSSKRCRAAEVHNLSEKRRRSRINEKIKALQNLIPNSNKTDKASMLDEAIEYLKQLQLQVQMLSMRNRLSLPPICLPGVQQPMQLPQRGMSFGEGNVYSRRGMRKFPSNEESSRQSVFNLANQCDLSNHPYVIHSGTNVTISDTSFGFEESARAHCEPLNLSYSKEIDSDGTLQLESDTCQIGKIS